MAAITKDPLRRQRAIWFLAVNVMALVVATAVFLTVLLADPLSVVFEPLLLGIYEQKALVVAIALSPLLASLLVGMAYAQRALRRKKQAAVSSTQPAPSSP